MSVMYSVVGVRCVEVIPHVWIQMVPTAAHVTQDTEELEVVVSTHSYLIFNRFRLYSALSSPTYLIGI